MAMFAALMAGALLRGQAGAPCACFGARSRVSRLGSLATCCWPPFARCQRLVRRAEHGRVARDRARPGARSLRGARRRRAGAGARGRHAPPALGTGALEIAGEGPELGRSAPELLARIAAERARTALAVFTSEGCHMCRTLEPAIPSLLASRGRGGVFDEVAEAEPWRELGIPGSPFAVALDRGRDRAGEGDLQQPRPARERDRDQAAGEGRAVGGDARPSTGQCLSISIALRTTWPAPHLAARLPRAGRRRPDGGRGGGPSSPCRAGEAGAFHFCGHIFTTGSCPHPTGMPRIDSRGYPIRARDGIRSTTPGAR